MKEVERRTVERSELILAIVFGTLGGLVVLLGYGPMAYLIRPLDALLRWRRSNRPGS